jgi:hypothetical protein
MMILCPLTASSVIVVALAAVGEALPLAVDMSAHLAAVGKTVLIDSLKVSVAVALTILLCVTAVSSAVWGSPIVTLTERGRAHVLALRVEGLQVIIENRPTTDAYAVADMAADRACACLARSAFVITSKLCSTLSSCS